MAAERGVQLAAQRFVGRACADPECWFVAFDRAPKKNDSSHIRQAEAGIVAGWPDTAIVMPEGRTIYCELKALGKTEGSLSRAQKEVGARLIARGHGWCWASSVTMYGEKMEALGLPLLPNWRVVAAHEDELAAAYDRKKQARRKSGAVPAPFRAKVKPTRKV